MKKILLISMLAFILISCATPDPPEPEKTSFQKITCKLNPWCQETKNES